MPPLSRLSLVALLLSLAGAAVAQSPSPFTVGPPPAGTAPPATAIPTPQPAQPAAMGPQERQAHDERLFARLKQGGLVVLMRHGKTDQVPPDAPGGITFGDCTTQRNLSAAGREDMRKVAEGFRQRGIPVEKVLSSDFCRASESAAGFGVLAPSGVETWNLLAFLPSMKPADRTFTQTDALAELRGYVTSYRGRGNLVVVTHVPILTPLLNTVLREELKEGEFAILRAVGPGRFDLLGRLDPSAF